jgi:hypothetical protein
VALSGSPPEQRLVIRVKSLCGRIPLETAQVVFPWLLVPALRPRAQVLWRVLVALPRLPVALSA